MLTSKSKTLEKAQKLMDGFGRHTGLTSNKGDIEQRYLWTDAFAVQTFFGLAHALEDDNYRQLALKLVDTVHEILGKYRQDDSRKGWISGLSEAEGKQHPTIGGLRIGKKLPERKPAEPFNERLEWDRDGQYFHYITRWFQALLVTGQETGEPSYANWAAELMLASGKFIYNSNGRLGMYWKMSTDLSRPLVPSMGAHDPLEGLICAESAREVVPQKAPDLEPLINNFKKICAGQNWFTTDTLGIGGLLLNVPQAATLASIKNVLPEEARPKILLNNIQEGLKHVRIQELSRPAHLRLAFRECGLSLGLRVLAGTQKQLGSNNLNPADFLNPKELEKHISLADAIEDFWSNPENQRVSTWHEHLDINAVTLAASLVAKHYPQVFSGVQNN